MDVQELVRLVRDGASDREIAGLVGLNRRTISRYRRWATQQHLLGGPLPTVGELHDQLQATLPVHLPPQQTSSVAVYQDQILTYRRQGLELAAIRARLEEQHGVAISYDAVWRLVRRCEQSQPPETFVRVEVPPGSEAQVDFGYAGLQLDPVTGRLRKSWGIADLSLLPGEPMTAPEAFGAFWQPARSLELLLSFAHRCRIQFVEPTFEVEREGRHESSAWHSYVVRRGRTRPCGWYVWQRELEAFLEHAYPKLRDPSFREDTGVELALAYYDANHAEDELEMNYLKIWTAVEVLVGRSGGGRGILAKQRFRVVCQRLEDALVRLQDVEIITEAERETLRGGLPFLNQQPWRVQAWAFFERLFRDYPAQDVTEEELRRFRQLRNDIVHRGARSEAEELVTVLHQEHMRLRSLVERAILALFHQRPNLMDFTWREWRAAR